MKVILGTMNFGPQLNEDDSRRMVERFLNAGNEELDTAYVYNEGATEKILGVVLPGLDPENYRIATKVHPRITGRLDGESVRGQLEESLARMKRRSVDLLYFHFPDKKTPVDGVIEECRKLFEEGKIKALGLSNFPAWKVEEVHYKCKEHGCPPPVVYEGRYNALSRDVEPELFPALRSLGMKFYAYNPLAGGLLTGKYGNYEALPDEGRFSRLKSYRDRYWKKSYFEAVDEIRKRCDAEGISMVSAAFRWLVRHSDLDASAGDGIILGASKMQQLEDNLHAIRETERLPDTIVDALDAAWLKARSDSPHYFTFF